MALELFVERTFSDTKLTQVNLCNEIIENYLGQGLRLTLRQLYYQLVTVNAITNEEKSYKRLGKLLSDARLAGLVDWDAIEDRIRRPSVPLEFRDLNHRVESALANYRLDRWESQPCYIELWVEKDALAGVLAPLGQEFHVTLMVNRGYSSQSAMYEAAERFRGHQEASCILLYLGDHDPSGEDMVRDIQNRLNIFGVEVDVRKLALTMDQVQQYNPPPNPAKQTDSRFNGYEAKFGNQSWEVDALPPPVLAQLVRDAIEAQRDDDAYQDILDREAEDKERLRKALESL